MTENSLETLMAYTTFHIGVYVSLTTIFMGASVLKKANHWTLKWAVFCFLVAGMCGGIIAANAAEYTGPASEFFYKPVLCLWWLGPWKFRPFSTVEYASFWAGLLPIAGYYLYGANFMKEAEGGARHEQRARK